MIYLTTDTHLGHENMIRICNRPSNFSDIILENWRKTITVDDTVIHLGDSAFRDNYLEELKNCPGKKILVKGNHDSKSAFHYMQYFDFVCNRFLIRIESINILFSHQPQWFHDYHINIHGHQHNLSREDFSCLHLPLAIENMGYEFIPMDDKFIKTLHYWNNNPQTIESIMNLHQDKLPLSDKDLYGFDANKEKHEWRIYRLAWGKSILDKHNIPFNKVRSKFENNIFKPSVDENKLLMKLQEDEKQCS